MPRNHACFALLFPSPDTSCAGANVTFLFDGFDDVVLFRLLPGGALRVITIVLEAQHSSKAQP